MKNTHDQLRDEGRKPPSSTPPAPPDPEAAPPMPSARLRSRPSANVVMRIERPAGANSAPPSPCRARNPISDPSDQETPHSKELIEKIVRPAMKTRRRPKTSARRPPRSSTPPKR